MVLWIAICTGMAAWAQRRPIAPVDCDDQFAECKEDCAIKWGGTTSLKSRAKLNPCINTCSGVERDCREAFFETKRNNLDEGSIQDRPPSRAAATKADGQKNEDNLPDGRRRDDSRPVAEEKSKQEPELKQEEVPKSNRSQISKVEDKSEKPKNESKPEVKPDLAARNDDPAPPEERATKPAPLPGKRTETREEPKKDEKKRPLDEWDP